MGHDLGAATDLIGVHPSTYPVNVEVEGEGALTDRNRFTSAFRPILALPHILLVGMPAALGVSFVWHSNGEPHMDWGAGTGVLGAVATVSAIISWFAIVFGSRHPDGLWNLAAFYLRWRVRAIAYLALLSDQYPVFGDGPYPAVLTLSAPVGTRDRLTVALRPVLALPHLIVVCLLGFLWGITTFIAWVHIIANGSYPSGLYHFGVGVLRWSTRVEAYLLLLRDEYPPFSLE
jgi:hypothetical protein